MTFRSLFVIDRRNYIIHTYESTYDLNSCTYPLVCHLSMHRYMFHLIVKDGIKYVCMSDRDVKRRVTFAFLTNVLNSFNERYQERIVR